MVNRKPKILLVAGMALALVLSACASSAGNETGTALPGGRRDLNLASTQNPFPAGVAGTPSGAATQNPFPAGASAVPSNIPGTQAPITGNIQISPTAGAHEGLNTPLAGTGGPSGTLSPAENGLRSATQTGDLGTSTAGVPTTGDVSGTSTQTIQTPAANGTQSVPNTGGQALLGAKIVPNSARSQAVLLSNMMDYNVVDQSGKAIGKVSDYILNMCESNIIYMLVNADPSLNLQGGNMLVIPYEEFTLGNGAIDVNQHNLVVPFSASQAQGAPVVSQKPDLSNTNWELNVRTYWNKIQPLSALSTQCQVPQGPVSSSMQATQQPNMTQSTAQANDVMITKIAYASNVLGMQVQDAAHNPVGQVKEVYLVPESGRIRYLAVNLNGAQPSANGTQAATSMSTQAATPMNTQAATSMSTQAATPQGTQAAAQSGNMKIVILPVGAVNLMQAQNGQGQVLVLVVQSSTLQNAPVMNSLPDVSQSSWDAQAYQYWNQYVPLTSGQRATAAASTPTPAVTATP